MIALPQHQAAKDAKSFKRLEQKKEECLRMVEVSRWITEFAETPLWKEHLLPKLEEQALRFQAFDAWKLPVDQIPAARAAALRSLELRDHILTNVGKSEHYQKEAEAAGEAIQRAIESGRAPQGDPK